MRWSCHRTLTLRAIEHVQVRFPRQFIEGLLQGCVEPDREPDYRIVYRYRGRRKILKRIPVSHHNVLRTQADNIDRSILVDYYIKLAVYYYTNSMYDKAGRSLGRALHYVQDSVLPSLGSEYKFLHDDLEKSIEDYIEGKSKINIESIRRLADKALEESVKVILRFISEVNHVLKVREAVKHKVKKLKLVNTLGTAISVLNIFLALGIAAMLGAIPGLLEFIMIEPIFIGLALWSGGHLKRAYFIKPTPPPGYDVALK